MKSSVKEKIKAIERLVTVDVNGRGIISSLYKASANKQDNFQTFLAADLINNLGGDGMTLITTGFLVSPRHFQETDGPIGAVSLARAIDILNKGKSVIACEYECLSPLKSALRGAGLNIVELEKIEDSKHSVAVMEFPKEENRAKRVSNEILNSYNFDLLMSIEKVGANEKGVYHNMKGLDISSRSAKMEVLMEKAKSSGIPIIGIGDGGNEIGMGKIKSTVMKEVPHGSECECPCHEGIASDFETDVLVTASVSNWGAYAIIATLSLLTEKDLLHSPQIEKRMLELSAQEGAVDGITGFANGNCDGLITEAHASIVQLLKELIS